MSNMGMKELGDLIRTSRERRGIRAYDLSYAIGQNPSWLSRIESGEMTHPPAPTVMEGLSRELGIPQATMLESLGYQINAEDSPAYDDLSASIAHVVAGWTPRQKSLLWSYGDRGGNARTDH